MDKINYKSIFFGALIGSFVTIWSTVGYEYLKNQLFVVPAMKNNLLIEITANQTRLKEIIPVVKSALNDIKNKTSRIDVGGPEKGRSDSIYNSYLNGLDLLSENLRSKIIIYYLNLENIDNLRNSVMWTFDRYNRVPQLASEENLNQRLTTLLDVTNNILGQGASIINEISSGSIESKTEANHN